MPPRLAAFWAAGLLVALTACGGGAESAGPAAPAHDVAQAKPGPREDNPSALDNRRNKAFPTSLIDPDEIQSGGPPPDGIPPIDAPKFEPAQEVSFLEPNEPVLSLTVREETRAYPLRIMTWHEIVNDTVGGVPVAVTYCPLCNSGVAFERQTADRLLSFGTSGLLYADNLVMYDRQTESLWPQLTGQAAIGTLTGEKLKAIPMGIVAWGDFVNDFPDARVLTQDTGADRAYGRNPYVGYDDPNSAPLFRLPGERDRRLALKERVIGVGEGPDAVAIVRASLVKSAPVEVAVGGTDVVVWHRPGQASALDADTIGGGSDIGTVGVFDATVEGRKLSFTVAGNGFRDSQTNSTWNVLGKATAGPLRDKRLQPYQHLDTFWFSWVQFNPETEIIGKDAALGRTG